MRGRIAARVVLVMSLAVTGAAWQFVRSRSQNSLETRFHARVGLIEEALLARAGGYEATMRAGGAFVSSSESVTQAEWEQFVRSLRFLGSYTGLTRLAFAADLRDGPGGGRPEEESRPAEAAAHDRLVVRLAAPVAPPPDKPFDLAAVPEYLEAAQRARATGQIVVSEYRPPGPEGVANLQALFLPVYAAEGARSGGSQVSGWIVAWLQAKAFLEVPRYPLTRNLDFEVFAGPLARDSHQLYDSDPTLRAAHDDAFVKRQTVQMEMFGLPWTLVVGAKPEFLSSEADAASLVFAAGLVASLALFVVTDRLASSHLQAVAAAKLMTERLRQSEAFSRAVIENAPVGIITVAANRSIDKANSAAARMFGYRNHELAGCLFEELLGNADRFRARAFAGFSEFRKETGRRADGSTFPIEMSAWPITAGEQQVHTVIVVDVTERLQAAEALRAERDFSATVLNLAPALVVVMDPDGRVVSFNRACEEATGYTFDEVRGKGFLDLLVPAEERAAVQRVTAELCSGVYPRQHESHWLSKDGRQRLISWAHTALRDSHGSMRFLIGCGVDVTEQREAERERDRYVIELERAQQITERQARMLARQADELAAARDAALESTQLKSQFLANMSHEIRTPMSGVLGMTHLLSDTELNDEQRDYVNTIRSSAEALLVILNDVLDFSKIEAGKLRFETLDFNLARTVEGTVQLLRLEAAAKGIELVSSIAKDVPRWLRGDPGRLRQVLVNLIGNAIKFTEQGRVEIDVTIADPEQESVEVRFDVRDSGSGIDPADLKNLFQAFVQADGSTSRKHGGTGLGLAISRELVQRMGGEIGCDSVPGEGSLFWFTARFGKTDKSRIPQIKGLRVLLVADRPAELETLKRGLASWEVQVQEASTWEQALDTLLWAEGQRLSFATVIVQTDAPEAFAEFAAAIRANPKTADVEILAWGQDLRGPHVARLAELGVKLGRRAPLGVSEVFNALVKAASPRDDAAQPGQGGKTPVMAVRRPPGTAARVGDKVLVVEDNPVNQKVAVRTLRNLGYCADVATNGLKALEAFEQASYGLILMDCQMPEMDGYQTTAEIRRREDGRTHIPIIALTAHAMQGDREKCLEAGMDDYLSKPIDPRALSDALNRWGLTPEPRNTETLETAKRTP